MCWLTNTGGMAISMGLCLFKIRFIFTLTAVLSCVLNRLSIIQPLYDFPRFPFVSFVFNGLVRMIKGFLINSFSRGISVGWPKRDTLYHTGLRWFSYKSGIGYKYIRLCC